MRLKSVFLVIFVLSAFACKTQVKDSMYFKAWADLYKIIDSAFVNRKDTVITEQAALVEFKLTKGKIDSFSIWSNREKTISNRLIPFISAAVNRSFKGYEQFNYVVMPLRVVDSRRQDKRELPGNEFIFHFLGAFKNQINNGIAIMQGIYLEPAWPAVK
jgi:hypothetical protein